MATHGSAPVRRLPPSLLAAARAHYRTHGYALLPGVVDAQTAQHVRAGALAATLSRRAHFADWPTIDAVLQVGAQWSDPMSSKLMTQLEQRQRIVAHVRALRRRRRRLARAVRTLLRGRAPAALSGSELWQLSELVAAAAETPTGARCTATVASDAQMLRAINACAANAWMTNSLLKELLLPSSSSTRPRVNEHRDGRDKTDDDDNDNDNESDKADRGRALRSVLGQLARDVGGVEHPVVFGDAPVLREAYGSAVGYQCTAPLIGVRTNSPRSVRRRQHRDTNDDSTTATTTPGHEHDKDNATTTPAPAVTLLLFTYAPSEALLPPYVLRHSHTHVRAQYIRRVRPTALVPRFRPMESHVPHQVKHFCFDDRVVGVSLVSSASPNDNDNNNKGSGSEVADEHDTSSAAAAAADADAAAAAAVCGGAIVPGSVMVMDPHLLVGFGPNLTSRDEVIYRVNVVCRDAVPYMRAPSWIRHWRLSPRDVSFAARAVFPPLTVD